MTDLDTRRPEFTTALRGYDRMQVDDYIDRLQNLVAQAEDRMRDAELGEPDVRTEVGPRLTQIFELATEEAREVRVEARQEATETLDGAREQAEALVEEAEHSAAKRTERAAEKHAAQLDDYAEERAGLEKELSELETHKRAVVAEIVRLRDALGAAPGIAPGEAPAPALEPAGAEDETRELPRTVSSEAA